VLVQDEALLVVGIVVSTISMIGSPSFLLTYTRHEKIRVDKRIQYETRQGKARQGKTRQGKA
jgi:hypothetical protein